MCRVYLGFGVWGLGFGVWGVGGGVWGLGFGVWGMGGLGFGVWGLGATLVSIAAVRKRLNGEAPCSRFACYTLVAWHGVFKYSLFIIC